MTPQFQGGRRGSSRGRGPRGGAATARPKSSAQIRPLDPTATPPDIDTFRHWEGLGEEIQNAIAGMGITTPTPIQRLAIGPVLAGKDVIAKAETGTGKTLAFGAPMMAKIDPQRASVLGLVLCPTRELAEQVQKVLAALGQPRGIGVALIVGGEPAEPQVRALKSGAQVVVGTPGRILDLYKQKFLSFPWTEFAVLDEADVMFEIGFIDDVKEILSLTPEERQTLLFSATFPPELLKLARENTRDPAEVATASGVKTVDNIEQSVIFVSEEDRALALMRLIENSEPEDVFLVFCPRRTDVDKLMRRLERLPFSVKALHGGYDQAARFRVMNAFRTREVKALVATDVASRGLDVAHVTTVVNFGSPQDITDYTHRIGRTGRAGRKGRAITLVAGMDMRRWKQIEREATWTIPEVEPPQRAPRGGKRGGMRGGSSESGERERGGRERGERELGGPRDHGERSGRGERDGARADRAVHDAQPPRREPRRSEPRSAEPRPAPTADGRARAAEGRAPATAARAPAPWPADEHSPRRTEPARERAESRQIEPRPDDPIDRRDRPLRRRDEASRWPTDDEAPRTHADAPRSREDARRLRGDAPRSRADGPRSREDAPRSREDGPHTHPGALRARQDGARSRDAAPAPREDRGATRARAADAGVPRAPASRPAEPRATGSRSTAARSTEARSARADEARTTDTRAGDDRGGAARSPGSRAPAARASSEHAARATPRADRLGTRPADRPSAPTFGSGARDEGRSARGGAAPAASFDPEAPPERDFRPRGPDPDHAPRRAAPRALDPRSTPARSDVARADAPRTDERRPRRRER